MIITMNDSQLQTIADVKKFLTSTGNLTFKGKRRLEIYEWIEDTLIKFQYITLKKKHKGIIRKYIKKMTGYSRSQLNRLILQYKKGGKIKEVQYNRHKFTEVYTEKDIAILANTDELHDFPNGAAIKKILQRMYVVYHILEYKTISKISVGHIYNLRRSVAYLRVTKRYQKTKPHVVNIGIRKKPRTNGKPGYLRIDTVHQGDSQNGEKGVYHINIIDEVTQFEFVGAVEKISKAHLVLLLETILSFCPFVVLGFHSDNGGEYINSRVAKLLNKLLIEFTKSRSRHCNDNALVEGKNGSVIRKWMGYGFINQKYAKDINDFYFGIFNNYLNFHRACGFAREVKDKKGKIKKIYRHQDYMTPYGKLKSLPNAVQYLKEGVTFDMLNKIALDKTDNEVAKEVQEKRYKLFQTIFLPTYSSYLII